MTSGSFPPAVDEGCGVDVYLRGSGSGDDGLDFIEARPPTDLGFEFGDCVFDLVAASGELAQDLIGDAVDLPGSGAAASPAHANGVREPVAHLDGGERRCGLGVGVEAPGVEGPAVAVFVDDGVGDDVVVMRERVQGAAGEVPERGDRQPANEHRLAVGSGGRGVQLEVVEPAVVAGLDRGEDVLADGVVAEQGEDAEGLLGGEGEVVADSHCRSDTPFEERDEFPTGDDPLAAVRGGRTTTSRFGFCRRRSLSRWTRAVAFPGGDTVRGCSAW